MDLVWFPFEFGKRNKIWKLENLLSLQSSLKACSTRSAFLSPLVNWTVSPLLAQLCSHTGLPLLRTAHLFSAPAQQRPRSSRATPTVHQSVHAALRRSPPSRSPLGLFSLVTDRWAPLSEVSPTSSSHQSRTLLHQRSPLPFHPTSMPCALHRASPINSEPPRRAAYPAPYLAPPLPRAI